MVLNQLIVMKELAENLMLKFQSVVKDTHTLVKMVKKRKINQKEREERIEINFLHHNILEVLQIKNLMPL